MAGETDLRPAGARRLRVLHVGNVANYAYNIGKILQTDEIESHAINWDYYHFAARPEWEEGEFDTAALGDHFFPRIPPPAVTGFAPPDWYVHGPLRLAALHLIARNEGKRLRARLLKALLAWHLRRLPDPAWRARDARWRMTRLVESLAMDALGQRPRRLPRLGLALARRPLGLARRLAEWGWMRTPAPLRDVLRPLLRPLRQRLLPPPPAAAPTAPPILVAPPGTALPGGAPARTRPLLPPRPALPADFPARVAALAADYRACWPERAFDPGLLLAYGPVMPLIRRLLAPYDLVIGYALDGIWPLLAGKPYLAYEFGTIRNIPFADDAQGRLGFLAYRHARGTIVTNADNEAPAQALGLDHVFLPHVINEAGAPTPGEAAAFRAALVARHGGDFLVFHPPRQHWSAARDTNWDKGNDHLFRGFAAFVRDHAPEARCIAVAWGASLAESRALVEELGIGRNVVWIAPQPHLAMMRYIAACDVVADQFTLATFGGIPPKAFYLGKPVLTAFDPALHAWCFDEMPPIPPARTPAEIAAELARMKADPAHLAALGAAARAWYARHNAAGRIRAILLARIRRALAESRAGCYGAAPMEAALLTRKGRDGAA